MNDQGLAVIFNVISRFTLLSPTYLHIFTSSDMYATQNRRCQNRTDETYIGATFTMQLVSIILTIYFTQIFFIPSYTLWRRGTLDYSFRYIIGCLVSFPMLQLV